MKINLRSVAVLAICMLISIPPANAWNSIGHMAELMPHGSSSLQRRVNAQLLCSRRIPITRKCGRAHSGRHIQRRSESLYSAMAATWPDEIKANNSGYKRQQHPATDQRSHQRTPATATSTCTSTGFIDTPFSTVTERCFRRFLHRTSRRRLASSARRLPRKPKTRSSLTICRGSSTS